VILRAPSKTFLCGEYGVLQGGLGLVWAHGPFFEMEIQRKGRSGSSKEPLFLPHPLSPAGRYYASRKDFFDGFDFFWRDPHAGSGGFGASGAQFLFLWSFWEAEHGNDLSVHRLHRDFKKYDPGPSSGCDVLSQFIGGLVVVDPKTPELSQRLRWPFKDLSVLVVSTGHKIQTHDHLKTLVVDPFDDFEMVSERVVQNLKGEAQKTFLSGMTTFRDLLSQRKLVADHSVELLEKLKELPGLLVAK